MMLKKNYYFISTIILLLLTNSCYAFFAISEFDEKTTNNDNTESSYVRESITENNNQIILYSYNSDPSESNSSKKEKLQQTEPKILNTKPPVVDESLKTLSNDESNNTSTFDISTLKESISKLKENSKISDDQRKFAIEKSLKFKSTNTPQLNSVNSKIVINDSKTVKQEKKRINSLSDADKLTEFLAAIKKQKISRQ